MVYNTTLGILSSAHWLFPGIYHCHGSTFHVRDLTGRGYGASFLRRLRCAWLGFWLVCWKTARCQQQSDIWQKGVSYFLSLDSSGKARPLLALHHESALVHSLWFEKSVKIRRLCHTWFCQVPIVIFCRGRSLRLLSGSCTRSATMKGQVGSYLGLLLVLHESSHFYNLLQNM